MEISGFFSFIPRFQLHLKNNRMVTIIKKSIAAFFVDTVKDLSISPSLRRELVRTSKVKMPVCDIVVEEQRREEIGVAEGGSEKDAIAIYQRLNELGKSKDEDEAIAESMMELYCSHFRCFARNFNTVEVEAIARTRRNGKSVRPSKVEKRFAQYFAHVLLSENGVNWKMVQDRMHLIMPYRKRAFVNKLLGLWTSKKNVAIFEENKNSEEHAQFDLIEQQENCYYYSNL